MKFNFRKIASVLASTVMFSSTIAIAAATTLPAPFVQSGKGDALVVYGSNPLASQEDMVAATNIKAFLENRVTQTTGPVTTTTTPTTVMGGDSVLLAKNRTNNFNLGDRMNTFYSSIDNDQLGVVLADGTYENDNSDEFDYEQKINLGGNQLGFQQDDDFNDQAPYIGFDMANGAAIMNYTLDFTTNDAEGGTGFADLEDTTIDMLGRTYYISDAATTTNGVKLTLLDNANKQTVYSDDPVTVELGDQQKFDVELVSVDDEENEAVLKVNGKNVEVTQGGSKKIGPDTYLSTMKVFEAGREADRHYVEFSIGTGQIILENGQEVKMNNEQLSDLDEWEDHLLKSTIVNASTDISSISLQWTLKDDAWLKTGSELVLPGFETIKLSMGGFITPQEEVTTIKNSGTDKIVLQTEVTDGEVTVPLLYFNDSVILAVGKDTDELLKTSATSTLSLDDDTTSQFVISRYNGDDYESYVLKIDGIKSGSASNGKNTTTIASVVTGSNVGAEIDIGETEEIGDISVLLNSADEGTGLVSLTISGSGTVSANKLITKEGLLIHLPVAAANGTTDTTYQYVNVGGVTVDGASDNSYVMNFTEEDKDGDIADGSTFSVTIGLNGDNDAAVTATSVTDYETSDDSDDFAGYVISDLATETLYKTGSDQDTLDVTYHGEESYAEVYLSEASATISAGDGETGDGTPTTNKGILLMKDTDVTSATAKDMVVVGGSCVNKVAAELLGLTYGDGTSCGSKWQTATNVGAGQYLIQSFPRNGKIATLVAGYNAGDTTNAAAAFRSQTVDTTSGKKYTGSTGTTITQVTS